VYIHSRPIHGTVPDILSNFKRNLLRGYSQSTSIHCVNCEMVSKEDVCSLLSAKSRSRLINVQDSGDAFNAAAAVMLNKIGLLVCNLWSVVKMMSINF